MIVCDFIESVCSAEGVPIKVWRKQHMFKEMSQNQKECSYAKKTVWFLENGYSLPCQVGEKTNTSPTICILKMKQKQEIMLENLTNDSAELQHFKTIKLILPCLW